LDTEVQGGGFDSLTFQVTREGTMVVNQTFATVAAATAFLDDHVLNLGSNGVANVSGALDLVFNLSMTTNDAGAGFQFDLLFGNATFASADFDSDGDVDGADFLAWQRGLGTGTTKAEGDADGNGMVNAADLAVWQDQFGFQAGSVAATGGVPEPHAAALAAAALGGLLFRRRRAR
jgi:MYXO-CTERM domain-containing protein